MNNSEFEFIKGYENLYKINRNGEIYSCHYKKVMTPLTKSDGYHYVDLRKEGKRQKCYIHRLMALQYIENTDNKPEVDHIDRNNKNNTLENLRWVTRVENRKNRSDIIEQMSDEQKEERLNKLREYKRIWAENNRRAKGMKIKAEMNLTEEPGYKARKKREALAKETEEEKEERLRKRREQYKNKEQTEEQKEKARERARQQRLRKKEQEKNIE